MSEDAPGHVLAQSGAKRNRFLIKLVPFEGHQLMDLRYWYTTEDGSLRPTRKGLSLTGGHYGLVVETLARYEDAIQAWLSGASDVSAMLDKAEQEETASAVRAERAATVASADRARSHQGPAKIATVEEPRSRDCFSVLHRGGEDHVLLNASHPFAESVSRCESVDRLKELLVTLIAAYSRAKHAIADGADEGLFDLLERDWSERLASAARNE